MALFVPTQLFRSVTSITPDYLKQHDIKALALDVDNTLTAHGSQEVSQQVEQWLAAMKQAGVRMAIASNNFEKRVAPFAKRLGLQYAAFCCKPSPLGLARVRRHLGVRKRQLALVGDQIFTDALGANLYGIRMLMVQPVENDVNPMIRMRRRLEQPVLRRYFDKGGTLL